MTAAVITPPESSSPGDFQQLYASDASQFLRGHAGMSDQNLPLAWDPLSGDLQAWSTTDHPTRPDIFSLEDGRILCVGPPLHIAEPSSCGPGAGEPVKQRVVALLGSVPHTRTLSATNGDHRFLTGTCGYIQHSYAGLGVRLIPVERTLERFNRTAVAGRIDSSKAAELSPRQLALLTLIGSDRASRSLHDYVGLREDGVRAIGSWRVAVLRRESGHLAGDRLYLPGKSYRGVRQSARDIPLRRGERHHFLATRYSAADTTPRTTVRIVVSVCNAPNGGEGLNAAWELNVTGNDHIRRDVRVPEPVLNWCIGRCALA